MGDGKAIDDVDELEGRRRGVFSVAGASATAGASALRIRILVLNGGMVGGIEGVGVLENLFEVGEAIAIKIIELVVDDGCSLGVLEAVEPVELVGGGGFTTKGVAEGSDWRGSEASRQRRLSRPKDRPTNNQRGE